MDAGNVADVGGILYHVTWVCVSVQFKGLKPI